MTHIFSSKNVPKAIYSSSASSDSSDLSEEICKSSLTCVITFFQCICILSKTLADNSFICFYIQGRIKREYS